MNEIRQEFWFKTYFSTKSSTALTFDLQMRLNVTEHSLNKSTLYVKFKSHTCSAKGREY